jgi:hypothetical protein
MLSFKRVATGRLLPSASFAVVVVLAIAATVGCGASQPARSASTLDLRQVNWGGVNLPVNVCASSQPLKLNGGQASFRDPGGLTEIATVIGSPTYGTLGSGANTPVAALDISCNVSGTATGNAWNGLVVYTAQDAALHSLGIITPQADQGIIEKVQIAHGRITAYEDFYRAGDGGCCPSGHGTSVWAYKGGGLLKQSTSVPAA